MAETNDAERMSRFITGEVSRCSLKKKDRFDQYSLYIDGVYEDTREPFKGYVNTKSPIKVYETGKEDPLEDNGVTEGKIFQGRVYVSEVIYQDRPDKTFRYLNALSIEGAMEEDPYEPMDSTNPFMENPLS